VCHSVSVYRQWISLTLICSELFCPRIGRQKLNHSLALHGFRSKSLVTLPLANKINRHAATYKNSSHSSQFIFAIFNKKTTRLMLFTEIIAVYSQNYTTYIKRTMWKYAVS